VNLIEQSDRNLIIFHRKELEEIYKGLARVGDYFTPQVITRMYKKGIFKRKYEGGIRGSRTVLSDRVLEILEEDE